MRKIIGATFVSLDGVMQAPGGPTEDPTGGFEHGGWLAPYFDAEAGEAIDRLFKEPFDLLLGRRTYDIFSAYWPYAEGEPGGGIFLGAARRLHDAVERDHGGCNEFSHGVTPWVGRLEAWTTPVAQREKTAVCLPGSKPALR